MDQTTITTVSTTMQMNSEKTRSGQVKMRSSTSVFSNSGSPCATRTSFAVALYIANQTKKPTRKTIMTMGTLSGLATISQKFGSSNASRKKRMPPASRMSPPRFDHSPFERSMKKKDATTSVNDHWG